MALRSMELHEDEYKRRLFPALFEGWDTTPTHGATVSAPPLTWRRIGGGEQSHEAGEQRGEAPRPPCDVGLVRGSSG